MRRGLVIFLTLLALSGAGFWAYTALGNDADKQSGHDSKSSQEVIPQSPPEPPTATENFSFAPAKKSAHYVKNSPAHEAVLGSVPAEVSITFNFDLSPLSTISITKNDQEVSAGQAVVSADKLVLSKRVNNSGAGLYTVRYNACWPDGSCHDGQFQFGVR